MSKLLDSLRARGWKVELSTTPMELLPDPLTRRYHWLPREVAEFLCPLVSCRNQDETVWFLCHSDFSVARSEGFNWNEYERMAIEAAGNDPSLISKIHEFWDNHFPFMLAVHSDYDYLAVRKSDGSVVHGCAPEWEDPTPIADTFESFLVAFEAAARGNGGYPLTLFLAAG
jgi:hypothetical protein